MKAPSTATSTRLPSRAGSPPPTTISSAARGARPSASRYGVKAAVDHGWPTWSPGPPGSRAGNDRSSMVLPVAASALTVRAGRSPGRAIGNSRGSPSSSVSL
ncbi:hypothetical protein ACFQ3Z_29895 [Streptomyces nogalater]